MKGHYNLTINAKFILYVSNLNPKIPIQLIHVSFVAIVMVCVEIVFGATVIVIYKKF